MPDTITLLGSLAGLDFQAVVGKPVWVRVHYAPDGKLLGGTEPPGTVLGEPGYAPTGYGSVRSLVTDEQGLFGGVLPWEDGGIYRVDVPGDVTRYLMMGNGPGEHPAGSTVNVRTLPGPDEMVTPSVALDALVGEAVEDIVSDALAGKADADAVESAIAGRRAKGETVTPDDFTGSTDAVKLQAAIAYVISHDYPTLVLDRILDLTGAPPISIDKAAWSNRQVVTIEGSGGGIRKNSAGVVFTSATANTGDVTARGLKLLSTAGAGAVLWDGDKLLRISSSECEYRGWDTIYRQTDTGRFAQSIRFHKEHITGGSGPAFIFRESYDFTVDDCLIEDREAAIWNSASLPSIANRNLRITKNVIENCSGVPIKLAMCWSAIIANNHFEQNGGASDPHIDLATLTDSAWQAGVDVRTNMFQRSAAQIASHSAAIYAGRSESFAYSASGNVVDGGVLWRIDYPALATIHATGEVALGGGLLIYPGQEMAYITPGPNAGATANRPINPRIGTSYFDTTLGKLVTAKTAGTKASGTVRFTGGATASGNITITLAGAAYTVAVAAGDTAAQVRDKVVAANCWPTWRQYGTATATAIFVALRPGATSGGIVFNAGSTGVTTDYVAMDIPGTSTTWVDGAGTVA